MTNTIIDFAKTIPIAKERALKTAKTLFENRTPLFFGETKEYLYISAKDESWTIHHILEPIFEKKEVVRVTGWKRYEDLGVTVVVFVYDGETGLADLAVHPIVRQ